MLCFIMCCVDIRDKLWHQVDGVTLVFFPCHNLFFVCVQYIRNSCRACHMPT